MKKQAKELKVEDQFKKFQTKIIIVFSVIIFVVTLFLVTAILESSNATLRKKVSSLTAINSSQLQQNINSRLSGIESIAALLFADTAFYEYDATAPENDEYTRLKQEADIYEQIVNLGLMENFSDFAIIYANDHSVGWLSYTTENLFADDGLYETFSNCITRETTNDGWVYGLGGNTDRIFYVKRLNPNAILVTSIYNRELNSSFKNSSELEDMTLRLINEDNCIIFSSDEDEIGQPLPDAFQSRIQDQTESNLTVIDSSYLINANFCKNNWRIVCSIPTRVLLRENILLKRYCFVFAFVLALVFIFIGRQMIQHITKPLDGTMCNLQVKAVRDQLSGLLNKVSFQDQVSKKIAQYNADRYLVFIMLDADNFKQINDRLGHACGDQVIVRISGLLKRIFDDQLFVGRIGGDEFAVYMEFSEYTLTDIFHVLNHRMDALFQAYAEEFHMEHEKCGLSISAGICVMHDEKEMSFEKLYKRTDAALYVSKRNGKGQYTLYREGMEND